MVMLTPLALAISSFVFTVTYQVAGDMLFVTQNEHIKEDK